MVDQTHILQRQRKIHMHLRIPTYVLVIRPQVFHSERKQDLIAIHQSQLVMQVNISRLHTQCRSEFRDCPILLVLLPQRQAQLDSRSTVRRINP